MSGIHFISPQSQFCTDSTLIFCHLPHLYPSPGVDHATSELEETSWNAFDAIITLLQTRFLLCKRIILVLWTRNTVFPDEPQPPRDGMIARLDRVLCRVDELFHILASHGCEFTIFPSPSAFDRCLDRARETGGVFEEGDFDQNRGAESRVWRSVKAIATEGKPLNQAAEESKLGYWLRSNFLDWSKSPDMQFV